jgi:hypothetical protein
VFLMGIIIEEYNECFCKNSIDSVRQSSWILP